MEKVYLKYIQSVEMGRWGNGEMGRWGDGEMCLVLK
jgi:uncharacterized protein YeaC (DUF1315 family)